MRNIFLVIALCLLCTAQSFAQTEKQSVVDKVRYAGGELRYNTEQILKLENGYDNTKDLIRIKGYYYMPIYNINLYKGTEAKTFRQECVNLFATKYPKAEILSVALPQTDWLHETVKKKRVIVGFVESMYCYIIAKDDNDGYINARFCYKRYKDVGDSYGPLVEYWPKWERSDYLTPQLYRTLLTK